MATFTLPQDFFFGAAMSGPQTEGRPRALGRQESVWDEWSLSRPQDFHNRVTSVCGNDFMARYKEDLALLRGLGLTSYRTSIQWARLLDADGRLNPEGAAWYHELLAASREAGIECMVNLYHFDMPTALFRRGGWESREVVEAYAAYARIAFAEFGQEVEHWFTFNEPIVEPSARYQSGYWWPHIHSFGRARTTQYHISLAHALAVNSFRELQATGVVRSDARIGLINAFNPPYTREYPTQADLLAVQAVDGIHNRWWLDLCTSGTLPADILDGLEARGVHLPIRPGDKEILACGPVDWLGFNYYQPTRVMAPERDVDEFGNPLFAQDYHWPGAVMNKSRGWEIFPKGIYDFAMKMTNEYPELEWFVSENGIGVEEDRAQRDADGRIVDTAYRVPFVSL